MDAVALVGERGVGRVSVAAQRRQHAGELVEQRGVPFALRLLGGHVGVERVDPDAERHVALELGGEPAEHEVAARFGACAQLGQQARLADPRLAFEREARQRAVRERVERAVEPRELRLASNGWSHA